MFLVEAAFDGLLFVLKQQHFMNDRNLRSHLNLRQGLTDRFGDVLSMRGGAAQNYTEANDRGKPWSFRTSEFGRNHRNLKRARHAHDLDGANSGIREHALRGTEH